MRLQSIVPTGWKVNKQQKRVVILILVSLSLLLGFYCSHRSKPMAPPALKVVETKIVEPTSIKKTVKLIGTVHPKHAALLIAKTSGVLKSHFSAGQVVKKGDLIALVINPEIEKNYQLSKDALNISKAQYARFVQLNNKGFVSTRELDEKKQQLIDAQKEVARTKMELKNLHFYSSFDGIMSTFKVKEGTQVKAGEVIATVYNPSYLMVDVDIPCHYLSQIKEHQTVYIKKQKYHLSHLQRMMDDETHMCPADIDIQCMNCVIGDNIYVHLLLKEKKNALVMPLPSLFFKEGQLSLYKVVNNRIERVQVQSGIQEKNNIEIVSGLNTSDQVIIKSPERLYPGMEVSIYQPKNKKQGESL